MIEFLKQELQASQEGKKELLPALVENLTSKLDFIDVQATELNFTVLYTIRTTFWSSIQMCYPICSVFCFEKMLSMLIRSRAPGKWIISKIMSR